MKVETNEGLFWDIMTQGLSQILDAEGAMSGATNAEAMILNSLDTKYNDIIRGRIAVIKKSLAKIYEACINIEDATKSIRYLLSSSDGVKKESDGEIEESG